MGDTIVYACDGCGVTITSGHSTPDRACPACGLGNSKYEEPKWVRSGRLG